MYISINRHVEILDSCAVCVLPINFLPRFLLMGSCRRVFMDIGCLKNAKGFVIEGDVCVCCIEIFFTGAKRSGNWPKKFCILLTMPHENIFCLGACIHTRKNLIKVPNMRHYIYKARPPMET